MVDLEDLTSAWRIQQYSEFMDKKDVENKPHVFQYLYGDNQIITISGYFDRNGFHFMEAKWKGLDITLLIHPDEIPYIQEEAIKTF